MNAARHVRRRMEPLLRDMLSVFRVVILVGPRQSGKTTLARALTAGSGTFLSLDDPALLQVALDDPHGLIDLRERPIVIDEVQRGGDDLVRAVKMAVDTDSTPGAFLLTGSADFLTVPVLSESLAGRAVFLELTPLSQAELEGGAGFLEELASNCDRIGIQGLPGTAPSTVTRSEYAERVCSGGYPEAVNLSAARRLRWFDAYVRTTVSRDITELTGARRSRELFTLLQAAAARTAGELVLQDLHRDVGFGSISTTSDYVSHLEMSYLVSRLPAWSTNAATRVKRRSKIHLTDTGLAAAMLGLTSETLLKPVQPNRDQLFETFVVNEIHRQATALDGIVKLYHYRDRRGREIDLIVELLDGRSIGVEVKAGSTVRRSDAKALTWMRDTAGDSFTLGVVFHTGQHTLPLADRVLAIPISHLWKR